MVLEHAPGKEAPSMQVSVMSHDMKQNIGPTPTEGIGVVIVVGQQHGIKHCVDEAILFFSFNLIFILQRIVLSILCFLDVKTHFALTKLHNNKKTVIAIFL